MVVSMVMLGMVVSMVMLGMVVSMVMLGMVVSMVMMAGNITVGIITTGVEEIMAEEDSILKAGGITTKTMVVDGKVGIMILVKEEDIKGITMEDITMGLIVTMSIARWRRASRSTIENTMRINSGKMEDPNMKMARTRYRHSVITTEQAGAGPVV
jgi:hypothetical protein